VTDVLVALAAILGLAVGSFLNVVVWRVPRGSSVVRPGSACPACGHAIRARDNVPVVSWLLLRGRCRDCAAPIAVRYPLVEAGTAVLFALVTARFFGTPGVIPAYLYLAAIGVALTLIDLDVHRLPDPIVLPSFVVLAALLALASWTEHDWPALLRALVGGIVLLTFYAVLAVAWPGGMGWGDVKLAGLLGASLGWLGWGALVVGAFGAFFLGGLFSILLMALRRAGRRTGIPFGPWMVAGAAVGLAVGEQAWSGYLGLIA
jgi:leader peptidase (prepilin peptidase)/N-methyltransferase